MRLAYSRTEYIEGQPFNLEVNGTITNGPDARIALTPDGNTGFDSVLPDGTWTFNTTVLAQYQLFNLIGNILAIKPADPQTGKTYLYPCAIILP